MTKEPTEAQIQNVLRRTKSNPRKLAIAYLRAQSRSKAHEESARINTNINEIYSILSSVKHKD